MAIIEKEKKSATINAREDEEEKEPACTICGNVS